MRIPDSVASQRIDGELLILNVNSGVCFGLDEIGARIWTLAGQDIPVDTLCETLLKTYDAEPEELRSDIESLINDLCAVGVLEVKSNRNIGTD